MNTVARELEVPPESFDAMGELWTGDEESAELVRAIATPVIVAELRRLADAAEWRISPEALRARADELEAGQ